MVTVVTAMADIGNLRFYQRCGFRAVEVIPDAFTPAEGYPIDLVAADPMLEQSGSHMTCPGRDYRPRAVSAKPARRSPRRPPVAASRRLRPRDGRARSRRSGHPLRPVAGALGDVPGSGVGDVDPELAPLAAEGLDQPQGQQPKRPGGETAAAPLGKQPVAEPGPEVRFGRHGHASERHPVRLADGEEQDRAVVPATFGPVEEVLRRPRQHRHPVADRRIASHLFEHRGVGTVETAQPDHTVAEVIAWFLEVECPRAPASALRVILKRSRRHPHWSSATAGSCW